MPATAADLPQDLIDRGMRLPPDARRKFAALLLEGTDAIPAGDPELKAMLTQRWNDYQSGKIKALTLEESDDRLQRLLEELEQ